MVFKELSYRERDSNKFRGINKKREPMYSKLDIAAHFNVSVATVNKWIKDKILVEGYKVGNKMQWLKSVVMQLPELTKKDKCAYMTKHELCARYQVTTTTIDNWRKGSDFPSSIKFNGTLRWKRAEIEQWDREAILK